MKRIILSIFFLLSPISISGIPNFSIISPYNLLGIFLLFILIIKKIKIKYSILFFIFTILESLAINFNKSGLLLIFSLSPLFFEEILEKIGIKKIKKYVNYHFFILLIMFIIDFIYRFKFDIFKIYIIIKNFILMNGEINFYIYKVNSILFDDTNYTAVMIGIGILFYTHLKDYKIISKRYYKLYLSFLLFLFFSTFSRTAYIALVLCYFYKKTIYLKKKYKINKLIILLIAMIVIIFLFFFIMNIFLKDGSFKTKIYILHQMYIYLKNISTVPFLYGVGFGNSASVLKMYGHNSLIVFFVEGGILFFISFINLYYFLWKKYKNARDILLFVFMCTMSATQYNYIYLMIVITSLHVIKKIKN